MKKLINKIRVRFYDWRREYYRKKSLEYCSLERTAKDSYGKASYLYNVSHSKMITAGLKANHYRAEMVRNSKEEIS